MPWRNSGLDASPLSGSGRIERLVQNPDQIRRSLRAAGEVFQRNLLGETACVAFMHLLREVASADGEVNEAEEQTLQQIAGMVGATA